MLWRMLIADLKMIVRNRQALFWAIVFPLLFVTVFGVFRFDDIGRARVAIFEVGADADALQVGLQRSGAFEIEPGLESPDDARDALADGDLDFVVSVLRGGTVDVAFNESTSDTNRVFLRVIDSVVDKVNLSLAGARRTYTINEVGVQGVAPKYFDFVLPGLVGMAVMTYGIIGLAGTIAQYRGQKILKRIRATPLQPSTFIASVVIAHLVLALVQSTIVLLLGIYGFGGTVRGNLLALYLFVLLGNLTFLNIGFMVAARVESAEAASGLGNAVAMPMMFFSGVFFPTAGLHWLLRGLTSVLPLHPMVDAIRAISIEAASISELLPEVAQLAAWALVTYVIATRVFKFERA
jgi:ABC-2 type transport system permease protein